MEHNTNDVLNDKKFLNRAKSQCSEQSKKLKYEALKRKSFNVNEAVRSLDLALGRLKKSKLVNGECITNTAYTDPVRSRTDNMFIDNPTSPSINIAELDNSSLISMNFSHYELLRNMSQCNCHSDGAFSETTSDIFSSLSDITSRDEHLERYFRSAEMWSKNHKDAGPSDASDSVYEKRQ